MANVLKIVDVVDIGIEKEKARRDFYGHVAQHFDDAEMKDLFTRLRDWEEGHIRKFRSIRDNLHEPKTVESYPGEMQAYVDALVDDKLYEDVTADSFSDSIKTPVDAIQYGIGFEKDAILLFMELASMVQSKNKEVIMELMAEERQHIVHLIKLRKKYES
jgi:rubrerythrin